MLLPVVCYVKNRVEFKKNPHKDVRKFKVYNCLKTNNTIDILREDLSLSIKSAGHKTQLLVGQTNMPATSQEYWQLGILEER